jgi:prepilin-type processing-associated H-X9-DG protein
MEIITAVLGVAFAAFCVWIVVRVVNEPKKWQSYLGALASIVFLIGGVLACLIPPWGHHPNAARRSQCKNNLKQIGLALHNYHEQYSCFPPAHIADSNGRPMHSWRVLLLPYFDQAESLLYGKYRFDEPWDGPHNSKLRDQIVAIYNCPSDDHGGSGGVSTMTSYVAVVGPETAWPGSDPAAFRDFKDGTSNTLLVVEVANSGIHWMEPRDLHVVQMALSINAKSGQGISSRHTGGAQALLADGSVRFVAEKLDAETLRALLTAHAEDDVTDF